MPKKLKLTICILGRARCRCSVAIATSQGSGRVRGERRHFEDENINRSMINRIKFDLLCGQFMYLRSQTVMKNFVICIFGKRTGREKYSISFS